MATVAPEESQPEQLEIGSDGPSSGLRRLLLVLVVVGVVVLAGIAVWRFLPEPEPTFSLSDLEDVYAGMVRSDGTNDASVLRRENASDGPGSVAPGECLPLFDTTSFNRFPPGALDGVGTYWLGGRDAISLFTLRFDDGREAEREFERITTALDACVDRDVAVTEKTTRTGPLTPVETNPNNGIRQQTAYTFDRSATSRFAVHVFLLSNTVSWQFRYEPADGAYSPLAAQRLNDGLVSQMRSVQELKLDQPR